ncbi:iron-dependent peroxidase [Paenibacillus sp. JNUCC31]|uniref:iron-dependent peroxidase n=1 Tax=Paenibacillus TaxID=44249 RepID=UPI001786788F|nr:iron-dependent peroxidase [Paenibacillus sp. JNUCC-31]QOS80385.1 iron-dependent peroxidase [Paenibacillus sp. JNUCC-31]UOK62318.1 iron-dependent peroxidase [Paenibacillus sp. OVF10]
MNYIWDLIIRAKRDGTDLRDVTFVPARVYSPYMELSQTNLNASGVEGTVEVNPYYRFFDIFRDLFDINNEEQVELREALFDLVIHFLADMDLMQGMNKREYYIRFILKDMHSGVYGDRVRRRLELFGQEEQEVIACNMLRLYDTGEAVHLLRDTLVRMFPRSTLYANCEEKDELLLYIGQVERTEAKEKLELILELFLPVRFDTEIYWGHHFGILDVDYTMIQDGIALY